jgi:hypothetical protein
LRLVLELALRSIGAGVQVLLDRHGHFQRQIPGAIDRPEAALADEVGRFDSD